MSIFQSCDHKNTEDFLKIHCKVCNMCSEMLNGFCVDGRCELGRDLYERWKETAQELPKAEEARHA